MRDEWRGGLNEGGWERGMKVREGWKDRGTDWQNLKEGGRWVEGVGG